LQQIEKPEERYGPAKSAVNIGIEPDAIKLDRLYSSKISKECNEEENEGIKALITRKNTDSKKFTLLHIGATREPKNIFNPITIKDILFGQKLADLLNDWKKSILI
jgi:hypothetical protein